MDKDFESELKGSLSEATAAKQLIAKYFKRYGDSSFPEAKKYQLTFASKIMSAISKCETKHLDIYCSIIMEIFADLLCPEASAKYWTLYVNYIRYFHYLLIGKKEFEKASLIYKHISSYKNKLQTSENSMTFINIYCYHLVLQNMYKSQNKEMALREATQVVEKLTKLFKEILETNKKQNFQYPDVLKNTLTWLNAHSKAGTIYQIINNLPQDKVKRMFNELFALYGSQTIELPTNGDEIQEQAKFIIEILYILLQFDIMDKMQLQISLLLLSHCRTECRLQSNKLIAESFLLLYDYFKLLCTQNPITDFQNVYSLCCERFIELFNQHSKTLITEPWFGDFLVLIFFMHSQLQHVAIFNCFWRQMNQMNCFKSMFQLLMESMKLAPCISSETKLFTIICCKSTRKHVILSFAQIALTGFVFYCQNVSKDDDKLMKKEDQETNHIDNYKEMIQNNLLLILNYAFKIIDKMDCITSNSQEIEIILTRFKQATLNCKTHEQANTCISICELFLKIKTKISAKEWPLLLRRLYKTVIIHDPHTGRDIQMCYIASIFNESKTEFDINQIRAQINVFYAVGSTSDPQQLPTIPQENCLINLYYTTKCLFRPQLESTHKKLLHWLESQHILKYHKSNTALLHSLIKSSQSHYDFVVIAKLGKLQTYAMAKISSLYKSLKSKAKEPGALSRLDQLTFGHICNILLNEMGTNKTLLIESKDMNEELLENLLLREEMTTMTISNDLKRFDLAWEAFKAFEDFYERYDSEAITMDDAIIDWENILDDLAAIALCLQLSGYIEHCTKVWLLHYKCSRLIQDGFSALRGLAFFCQYSEHFENNTNCSNHLQLDKEIENNFLTITQELENLANIQRKIYQNYVLLAVLQIAYYYARSLRLSFAQMLLQYVEEKHAELPGRQGRYDIIMATMDAIKFRLLWKHNDIKGTIEEKVSRTNAENLLLHSCLLHEVEETLDRLHDFSHISSNDGLLYSILIVDLVQELAECTANRLCDNFLNAVFIASCRIAFHMGLALRLVQIMGMWMWVNLQMEDVDRAQTKLKIIEYVMGIKSLKELTEKSTKSVSDIQSSTISAQTCSELKTPNRHNPGMEAIRRLAQVQLSPIKTDKLQLSPSHRNSDLQRYFKCNIDSKVMPQNEQIEWTLFMVGCLNARLYFLVEDYDQLSTFYERGQNWLQMRQNSFNKKYYINIQLMAIQHYANFLRAQHQYDKALQCLSYGIELCKNKKFYIDAVYCINLQLQLMATKKEINVSPKVENIPPTYGKLRRALQFNISPDNQKLQEQAKKEFTDKLVLNVMASGKKTSSTMRPLPSIASGSGCTSSKKAKTQAVLDIKAPTRKTKPLFEICEDSVEIVEITDNEENAVVSKESVHDEVKYLKRTKTVVELESLPKTPKTVRKTTKSSKSTTKSSVKIKRPAVISQNNVDIDLTDSPLSSPKMLSNSSSSENLDTKENLDANSLIAQMDSLDIKGTKRTKTSSSSATLAKNEMKTSKGRGRRPNLVKESMEEFVIVLEDSPCSLKPASAEITDKPITSKTRVTNRVKSPRERQNNDKDLTVTISQTESRPRRQRKLVLDKSEESDVPPTVCSNVTTPSVTRRRQKNLF